jgi:hypothetical protein
VNNELIEQKSWWKKNWKWFMPVSGFLLILLSVFISSGIGGLVLILPKLIPILSFIKMR